MKPRKKVYVVFNTTTNRIIKVYSSRLEAEVGCRRLAWRGGFVWRSSKAQQSEQGDLRLLEFPVNGLV